MPKSTRRKVRDDLIRGQDAARIIGVTRPTVVAMYAREELKGKMISETLFIDRQDAHRVRAERDAAERLREEQAAANAA